MIRPEISHLAVPIDTLRPYARNPRCGDTDVIVESLRAHGQYRPIVVRRETNEVLAGNHTYAAMLEVGATEIAVTFVDCTDEQAAKIVIVDNRANDLAMTDDGLLADLLADLDGLSGTGWDDPSYDRLLADLARDKDWIGAKTEVAFALGLIRFVVPSDEYREWADDIRAYDDPAAELRMRLGLPDEAAAAPSTAVTARVVNQRAAQQTRRARERDEGTNDARDAEIIAAYVGGLTLREVSDQRDDVSYQRVAQIIGAAGVSRPRGRRVSSPA